MCVELACCDGSDEPLGVCTNKCKEVGEAYRAKQAAERKIRKTVCRENMTQLYSLTMYLQGSKIRSTYVAFAQKEKKRIEGEIVSLEAEISTREKEVDRLRSKLYSTYDRSKS